MHFSWLGFWTYSVWSLEFLYVWPMWLVTAAIFANLAIALAARWPFRADRWKNAYWLLFANFLFLPAMVAIAESILGRGKAQSQTSPGNGSRTGYSWRRCSWAGLGYIE